MENTARRTIIYLSIDCEDKAHDLSLAFGAAFVPVLNVLYDTRWQYIPRSEIFRVCADMWEDVFQKTARATHRALSALVCLPATPVSAQLCMRALSEKGAFLPPEKIRDSNVAWCWAIHCDCSQFRLEPMDQWINRYVQELVCIDT
ncbi:hypothetical protein ANCCAN_20443 [Ancylostoma caninum]|uniref:Uncharacterized protein n=1 Tax=Ancylostoma caninum TaxID=29170 RepID=A0A368FSB6_ANCCA|nr:hypothetical protein ANCCAN_20443 [Ancylostoma caninum]